MLTEDQIDYLFQIKESAQPIPDGTVRLMLKALRWTPEEIERGVSFLKRPNYSKLETTQTVAPESRPEPGIQLEPKPPLLKHIVVKQNPFPVGSPFAEVFRKAQEKKHRHHMLAGFIFGGIVFIAVLIVYAKFAEF